MFPKNIRAHVKEYHFILNHYYNTSNNRNENTDSAINQAIREAGPKLKKVKRQESSSVDG